jgi:membrane-bound lytic murein transglycosylase A
VRPTPSFIRKVASLVWLLGALGTAIAETVDPLNIPDTQLEPVTWARVDGWEQDNHTAAFKTFMTSCRPFLAAPQTVDIRPVYAGLAKACRRAVGLKSPNAVQARKYFEDNFRPVRIAKLGESTGLLTGYYEPIVEGSRFPTPEFSVPLYRRPRDILVEGRQPPAGVFPNRATVGRRNAKNEIEPYYDRLAIEEGALDGQKLEICWIKDPFEAMSIQIQGSARIKLEDGTLLRLNYDGHNGFGYTAVGRILIERNLIPRDEMSMDRIKRWMHANPDQAREVRGTNRSFVFFRITGLNKTDEPVGAQGVPLDPGRSIAVDKTHVYGTPFFIEAELPLDGARPTKFRRLMVAQDTGAAIMGPARADLYWGAGDDAGRIAGRIRHQGRFVLLLPRELDMVAAGKKMPIPRRKPAFPEKVATNVDHGTTGTENQDAKNTQTARSPVAAPRSPAQQSLQQAAPKSTSRPGL